MPEITVCLKKRLLKAIDLFKTTIENAELNDAYSSG